MTPMPTDIIRTISAYRRIICKVQIMLQRRGMRMAPLAALSLASLPPEQITVAEAKRLRLVLGANPYNTVEALSEAGFVRCSGGDKDEWLAMQLTTEGAELGEAVRLALTGQHTGEIASFKSSSAWRGD